MRHAARPHPGARQARGRARAARAPAPARRAAADRARLGDARRCRRPTARGRSSSRSTCTPRGGRRAQRRARAACRAHARPAGRRGHARAAGRGPRARRRGVEIDPTPQEVSWTVPLDEDDEHATYDTGQVAAYFAAATQAALVLAAFRAPVPRALDARSTPGGARSTSRSTCSPAGPPTRRPTTSSCATRWTPRRSPIGWWPGDRALRQAAFYAYAHPAPDGFADATLSPGRGALGRRARRVRRSTGTTSAPPPTRTPRRSSSPARRFRHALRGLRVGPGAARQRRGHAAAGGLEVLVASRQHARQAESPELGAPGEPGDDGDVVTVQGQDEQ